LFDRIISSLLKNTQQDDVTLDYLTAVSTVCADCR